MAIRERNNNNESLNYDENLGGGGSGGGKKSYEDDGPVFDKTDIGQRLSSNKKRSVFSDTVDFR